jgi:hypothetical protein
MENIEPTRIGWPVHAWRWSTTSGMGDMMRASCILAAAQRIVKKLPDSESQRAGLSPRSCSSRSKGVYDPKITREAPASLREAPVKT